MPPSDAGARPDTAGVVAPPPLIYLVPLAAGLLVTRGRPTLTLPPGFRALHEVCGAIVVALGLVLIVFAVATFRRARTPVIPTHPSAALVESGPFRWTRNPMYLGFTLIYIGTSVAVLSLWTLVLLPFVQLVMRRGVIDREERYLTRRFGDAYRAYMRRVRRWV